MKKEDLAQLRKDLAGIYSKLHKEFREDEKYYELNFLNALGIPDEFVQDATVLPTAAEVIDVGVEHVAPSFRRVTVPRATTSSAATERAVTLAKFYEALLSFYERSGPTNPYRMVTKHLFTYGMGVLKEQYNPNLVPMEPIKIASESDDEFKVRKLDFKDAKSSFMPLTLEVVNPLEVLPDPWSSPPQFVIQVSRLSRMKAQQMYPDAGIAEGRATEEVEVIEYWDEKDRSVLINEKPNHVRVQSAALLPAFKGLDEDGFMAHGCGRHPYSIYASGYGIDDSGHRPENLYVGLIRKLRSLLQAESRGFSVRDIVLKAGAWPFRVARGDKTSGMEDFKLEYGTIKVLPDGVSIEEIAPQSVASDLHAHTADTTGRIEKNAAPRSVRGSHEAGVEGGFQTQLLLGEARLKYGAIAEVLEKMMGDICRIAAMLVERKVDGKITLMSDARDDEFISVSGSTVNGHHAVSVKINVAEPEDEIRKHQDAQSMVSAGLWTRLHAIAKTSPDVDPKKMLAGTLMEGLLFSAPVMQLLGQVGVQNIVENLDLAQMLEQLLGATEAEAPTGPSDRTPSNDPEEDGGPAGSPEDQAVQREADLRETGGPQ